MNKINLTEKQKQVAALMVQGRKQKKMTQIDVADYLKINNATLSKYETGRLPFPDAILIKLSNLYDIDYYNLPGVEKPRLTGSKETMPLIGRIVASRPLVTYSDPRDVEIPHKIKELYPNGYLLEASGDSMNKLFPDGQLLVIDPDAEISTGMVCAVRINGDETTVKRVICGKNLLVLQPDSYNPEHQPMMISDPEILKDIYIEGEVVWDMADPDKKRY